MKILKALLLVAAICAFFTGSWLLTSLYLMVGIGIAHLDWWHAMPTMGYHTALLIDIFLGGFIAMSAASSGAARRRKS